MSGYEPVGFHEFGGLNIRDAPDDVGANGAIDMLNVDLDETGAVRQRDGYDNFTSPALTNRVASLAPFYTTNGSKYLIAGCGTRLEAIATAGTATSQTGLTDGTWDFTRFGGPGVERIYALNGANRMYYWDAAAWATAATNANMRAKYGAVMAVDQGNRMVLAGFTDSGTANPNGGQAYTSQVWFSDAGAPETYSANNYVQLTPGDGELIQGVVAWREFVFVFKQTKFFVFYGTSTSATGTPIFNYRTIDTGVGLASPRAVAVGTDGVYFMARNGVYRTTGGDPELLSGVIDPIFGVGNPLRITSALPTLAHDGITQCAAHFHNERFYLAIPIAAASANSRVLVYDPRTDNWMVWLTLASSFASFRIGDTEELVFGYSGGSNHVGRFGSSYTNDDGTAITSRYQTGFYEFGLDNEKSIAETILWGSGTVGFAMAADFGNLDTATTIILGSAGTIQKGGISKETSGDFFSHSFASVSGAFWNVNRLTHGLRESRPFGLNQ